VWGWFTIALQTLYHIRAGDGGWTSICQLFWCSPEKQGFDTHPSKKSDHGSSASPSVLLNRANLNHQQWLILRVAFWWTWLRGVGCTYDIIIKQRQKHPETLLQNWICSLWSLAPSHGYIWGKPNNQPSPIGAYCWIYHIVLILAWSSRLFWHVQHDFGCRYCLSHPLQLATGHGRVVVVLRESINHHVVLSH